MGGQLAGLRVLDLTIWRPGPYATQLLAEQGADVLKVEPPGGDPMRAMPDLFDILGAGKRSIVLNLKDDADRETCLRLAEDADVFVESYRPGVAQRLGVGYDAVRSRNPKIVYCSVSGFGATGPLANQSGHDAVYLAYSGVLRPSGGPPRQPTIPIGDLSAGPAGAFAILAACWNAQRTGEGERVDVALTDILATWVGPVGPIRHTTVDGPLNGVPGYGVFETADGEHLALAIMDEDHFWVGLCNALGMDEHAGLDNRTRNGRVKELNAQIAGILAGLTRAAALERLEAHDVPAAPVLDRDDMLDHPHFRARGVVVDRPDGTPGSGPLVRFENRPGTPPYGAPDLGTGVPSWRS